MSVAQIMLAVWAVCAAPLALFAYAALRVAAGADEADRRGAAARLDAHERAKLYHRESAAPWCN